MKVRRIDENPQSLYVARSQGSLKSTRCNRPCQPSRTVGVQSRPLPASNKFRMAGGQSSCVKPRCRPLRKPRSCPKPICRPTKCRPLACRSSSAASYIGPRYPVRALPQRMQQVNCIADQPRVCNDNFVTNDGGCQLDYSLICQAFFFLLTMLWVAYHMTISFDEKTYLFMSRGRYGEAVGSFSDIFRSTSRKLYDSLLSDRYNKGCFGVILFNAMVCFVNFARSQVKVFKRPSYDDDNPCSSLYQDYLLPQPLPPAIQSDRCSGFSNLVEASEPMRSSAPILGEDTTGLQACDEGVLIPNELLDQMCDLRNECSPFDSREKSAARLLKLPLEKVKASKQNFEEDRRKVLDQIGGQGVLTKLETPKKNIRHGYQRKRGNARDVYL